MQASHCDLGSPKSFPSALLLTGRILCREAFAAWLPFWGVPFSYAVAIAYVLTDTADKGTKAYKTARKEVSENRDLNSEVNVPR